MCVCDVSVCMYCVLRECVCRGTWMCESALSTYVIQDCAFLCSSIWGICVSIMGICVPVEYLCRCVSIVDS